MSIFLRSSATCAGYLAASVLALSAAAPASVAFAHGSGGGHFSMSHAITGMPASRSLPSALAPIGQMASPIALQSHDPQSRPGELAHEHHPTPPSTTSTTSTVVTTPDADITFPPLLTPQDTVVPSVSAPTTGPTTAVQQSQVPDTSFSSGGTLAADQHPGGGGDTLASCMAYWQPDTTMTKAEWHDTCARTLNGLDAGGGVTDNLAAATTAGATSHHTSAHAHRGASQHAQVQDR